MKKFSVQSMLIGFILGVVGMTGAFAVFAAAEISSANFSTARVYFYGQEVPLENSLVLITKGGETSASMYMPVRELLEYMNFIVEWDGANNVINLTMRGNPGTGTNNSMNQNASSNSTSPQAWSGQGVYAGGYNEPPSSLSQTEAGRRAIDIMQRTGNWSFIEPYLPHISNEDIQTVVSIFNSKRPNHPGQHRQASDYFN